MKRFRSRWLSLGLVFVFAGNGGVCGIGEEPARDDLSQQDIDDFAWFDGLGYPDLSRARLVRVATGWWSKSGDDPPQNSYVHALLQADKGDTFTVFMLDLSTRTFTKTPPDTPDHERVGYEAANLAEYARAQLKQLQGAADDEDRWRRFGERISERAEVFALARTCAAQGQTKLAHQLLTAAVATDDRRRERPADRSGLRKLVENDICHARMWRAVESFGDSEVSREELLKEFQFLAKHFADSSHHARAQQTAELLEKMIAEDKVHAARRRKDFDKLPKEQQIQELIYQLRNQNGQQWSQPGACDIFLDPRGEESPAARLVAMGYDAVPALIEVVDDKRFTRSVGYHRNFYFSHHVLRVGDCARTIIERIAGRSFDPRSYNGAMIKNGQASEVKQQIQAWWKEFQTKGEKRVLVEAVERADDNSPAQAERLVAKYPDDALEPIIAAVRKSEDSWQRTSLIAMAARLPGDAVEAFLRQLMSKAPQMSMRVAAARALLERGHEDAIPPMIEAWDRLGRKKPNGDDGGVAWDADGELIELLADSGRPEAIRALGEDFGRHSASQRLEIVWALGDDDVVPLSKEAVEASQAVLVTALDDTEERMGMSGSWGGKSFSDPRICDMAGHILWLRFPEQFEFDLSASRRERDRQILNLKNTWRTGQGLPALPAPMAKTIVILPAEKVDPLLQLAAVSVAEDRRRTLNEIERLGLGALPAAKAFTAELPEDHAAKPELDRLVRRLSNVVGEPIVSDKSIAPQKAAREHLAAVTGKPLTGESFVKLLTALAGDLPEGAAGVKLLADRDGDDSGVVLTVEFTPRSGEPGKSSGWKSHKRVRAGGKGLHGSWGSSTRDYALNPERHDDLLKSIDEALASSPELSVEIRASLEQQEAKR